ncbi:MAG: membrane protein insertase YidC [Chromatiales bacterium]|jgi:YidC/Oxa1 family membrane protein insertase
MDNQRPILYLALIFVGFLIWQAWQQDYGPQPPQPQAETGQRQDVAPPAEDVPLAATAPAADSPTSDGVPRTLAHTAGRVRVRTDVLDVQIDRRGGDIRRVDLPTYPVSLDRPEQPVTLLEDRDSLYIAQSGLIHDAVDGLDAKDLAPSHHAEFTAERSEFELTEGQDQLEVVLTWQGPDGVTVDKLYRFSRGSFAVELEHRVRNGSARPWLGSQYRQLRHSAAGDDDGSRFLYTYTGSAYYDGKYEKLAFEDMASDPLDREVAGGWVAMLQHYFLSAWLPEADATNRFYSKVVNPTADVQYIIGMRSENQRIEPGETGVFATTFYAGPKIQEDIEQLAEGLSRTVDYGIFWIFARPLFLLLEFIHDFIGNWGWAIIIVTILIKLAFYKLSETSYRSMARMRAVQPKLVALKERYADDKQRMNQALMELYKTEKINPLGGCLPIVVQIPVFIAFYWMLLESVEMRQAPFMLWIQDLSAKDPYFVLPVLMGVTMIVQQKLNPAPLDPLQQKVMMLLPIVFTVFFAFFPAGLVLYWFVNNLLSIAQQWVITRRIEQGKD